MHAIPLSLELRGRRLSSLALFGAVALAACDTDRSVGPNTTTTVPTEASLAKGPKGGTLVIVVMDQDKKAPVNLGAQFTVAKAGSPTYFAVDNSPTDNDATVGVIRMTGFTGNLTICQTVAPTDHVVATPACQTAAIAVGATATVEFVNLTLPRIAWETQDIITYYNVGGATYSGDDGSGSFAIVDNSPIDLDPTPGKIEVMTKGANFTVCPKTAPADQVFYQNPPCKSAATPPGQTTKLAPFYVAFEASAYWWGGVSGNPGGIGAEYVVTAANGGFSVTVVNNGMNDLSDPAFMVYVKLGAPGWYTVCQTKAPAGGQLADPACQRILVELGHPAYAGFFDSKPI